MDCFDLLGSWALDFASAAIRPSPTEFERALLITSGLHLLQLISLYKLLLVLVTTQIAIRLTGKHHVQLKTIHVCDLQDQTRTLTMI